MGETKFGNDQVDFRPGLEIGGDPLHSSAILQLDSTTKGFIPPRMTTVQRTAIATPATGLMVYDTDEDLYYFWTGTTWTAIGTGVGGVYATDVGDAINSTIVVNHLLGTKDVFVAVYDNSAPFEQVFPDVQHTDADNITLVFASIPTLDQYRCVVGMGAGGGGGGGGLSQVYHNYSLGGDGTSGDPLRLITPVLAGSGSPSLPAYSFHADADTGMYWSGPDQIGFACNGFQVMEFSPALAQFIFTVSAPRHQVVVPGPHVVSDLTKDGSNNGLLSLANSLGVEKINISGASGFVNAGDGAVTGPSYTFKNDPNTGIYSAAADKIGFAANGTEVATMNVADGIQTIKFSVSDGAAATPSYTFKNDPNTGIYSAAADKIGFAANGTEVATMNVADGIRTTKFKFVDGNQGVDKVLTSDAAGVASWVVPAAGAALPVGTVLDYAASSIPSGYLECNGAMVSKATYAALWAVLGATWGAPTVSDFALPDLRRFVTMGAGGSKPTGSDGPSTTVGSTGGSETNTLTEAQLAVHQHAVNSLPDASLVSASSVAPLGVSNLMQTFATFDWHTEDAGSGDPHNNVQPSAVVRKIIKY